MSYSPINEPKLKRKAKDYLKCAREMLRFSFQKFYAPSDVYEELLFSISPSERNSFLHAIPFEGKTIVRHEDV